MKGYSPPHPAFGSRSNNSNVFGLETARSLQIISERGAEESDLMAGEGGGVSFDMSGVGVMKLPKQLSLIQKQLQM